MLVEVTSRPKNLCSCLGFAPSRKEGRKELIYKLSSDKDVHPPIAPTTNKQTETSILKG